MRALLTCLAILFALATGTTAQAEEKFTLRIKLVRPDLDKEGYPKTKPATLILGASGVSLWVAGMITTFVHSSGQSAEDHTYQSGMGVGLMATGTLIAVGAAIWGLFDYFYRVRHPTPPRYEIWREEAPKDERRDIMVVPTLTQGGGGLTLTSRF